MIPKQLSPWKVDDNIYSVCTNTSSICGPTVEGSEVGLSSWRWDLSLGGIRRHTTRQDENN